MIDKNIPVGTRVRHIPSGEEGIIDYNSFGIRELYGEIATHPESYVTVRGGTKAVWQNEDCVVLA